MARTRSLSDADFHQLLKLAAGLLRATDGDIVSAMSQAMQLHIELLRTIRHEEIASDLGPGNAILYVPEEGGLAIRLERHPAAEMVFPEIDLTGFEVTESYSSHYSTQPYDGGVLDDWD
jgi:hypothetical protein